jgi:hypothetical protein
MNAEVIPLTKELEKFLAGLVVQDTTYLKRGETDNGETNECEKAELTQE